MSYYRDIHDDLRRMGEPSLDPPEEDRSGEEAERRYDDLVADLRASDSALARHFGWILNGSSSNWRLAKITPADALDFALDILRQIKNPYVRLIIDRLNDDEPVTFDRLMDEILASVRNEPDGDPGQ